MIKLIANLKNSVLKKFKKGFTLVELLAVIVILAIIMLIAIPAVLSTLESSKRKAFYEYVDKSTGVAQKQFAEDQINGSKNLTSCYVYNIKTELNIADTGDFDGWVLINPVKNDIYITLFNNDYVLIGFHYSDSSLKMEDYVTKRNNDNESKLTVEELCNLSSCSTCNIADTNIPNVNNKIPTYLISGESFQSKLANLMCPGIRWLSDCKKQFSVVMNDSNVPDDATLLSTDDSEHKMYAWVDQDNLKMYFYTDANSYVMNSDSYYMFYGLPMIGFDYSKLDFSNVTNLSRAFGGRRFNEDINLSNANVSKVSNMEGAFAASLFNSLNLNNWKALNISNMLYLFQSSTINTLKMDNTKFVITPTSNDIYKYGMISAFYNLKTTNANLDLNNWDVSKVVSLQSVFYQAVIPSLNISEWDVSNVTDMVEIFGYLNTNELILNKWNTSKVISAKGLARYSVINKIDLSNWDLSHIGEDNSRYYGYELFAWSGVGELILNNFNLSNCNEISGFIYECNNLKNIDLSGVNFSGVKSVRKFIYNCDNLEVADIRNVDFSSVTSFSNIFQSCGKLKTIYANENTKFSSSMISDTYLFSGDLNSLVGGNGLKYSSGNSSGSYANYENGYFTYKA